jgi:type IV pilus assembly protein PilQ
MQKKVGIFLLALILFSFTVSAEGQKEITLAQAPLPAEAASSGPPAISMDFQDANLKDILKLFSQQAGLNFIASEKIKDRRLTLYLDNVSVQDALDTIMRANNLTYEQLAGSNIFVVKEWGKPDVETVTRVYYLKYARVGNSKIEKDAAKEITPTATTSTSAMTAAGSGDTSKSAGITATLKEILTENGKIIEDPRTNSLIITDIPSQFAKIEQTLAKLDVPTAQVMIEVELLETSKTLVDKIGIEWGDADGIMMRYRGPVTTTRWPWMGRLGEKIATYDGENPNFDTGIADVARTVGSTSIPAPGVGVWSLLDLQAALHLLRNDTRTRILARPRVLTLNNERATVEISTDEAVGAVINASGEGAGAMTTTSVERMKTGVLLSVTPQVNEKDGIITMMIEPRVIDAKASQITLPQGGSARDPTTRGTRSLVMVKDGETVIIGGLIRNSKNDVYRKVPFLGDIPFIGQAFKYENTQDEDRELIIFITPHVVQGDSFSPPVNANQGMGSTAESVLNDIENNQLGNRESVSKILDAIEVEEK